MRGKGHLDAMLCSSFRITPACAGKSSEISSKCPFAQDHPRVCGEKAPFLAGAHIYHGSPPRVRGKGSASWTVNLRQRITPACAGKRSAVWNCTGHIEDHPRVCGEKDNKGKKEAERLGSPPRVRGKASSAAAEGECHGITPACAGKSFSVSSRFFLIGDHPRVCGEKPLFIVNRFIFLGSPPRVRGKVDWCKARTVCAGITPACAGKRGSFDFIGIFVKDHPRVCGEKKSKIPEKSVQIGSPPRVRGKAPEAGS